MTTVAWREEKERQYRELFPDWDDDKIDAMVESLENIKRISDKEKRKRKNK